MLMSKPPHEHAATVFVSFLSYIIPRVPVRFSVAVSIYLSASGYAGGEFSLLFLLAVSSSHKTNATSVHESPSEILDFFHFFLGGSSGDRPHGER